MSVGKLFVVALIAVSLAGCNITINKTIVGVQGSGTSATESRDVDDFDAISIEGFGNVNVDVGQEKSLTITGDDNLLPLIESTVANGKLTIRPKESINPKTEMVFDITVPNLNNVELSGAAKFELNNIDSESFELEMHGAGKVAANGTAAELDVEVNGASSVDLKKLEAAEVKIEMNGAASGKVHASESVNAEINGVGTITVYGNPSKIDKEINGLGRFKVAD